MKRLIILLFLLSGCSFTDVGYFGEEKNTSNVKIIDNINFEDDYTIDEYITLLEKYSKDNDYPNMNK